MSSSLLILAIWSNWQFVSEVPKYSSVPNRRAVQNKRAGGKILKETLNVQGRIDVQGGKST